MADQGFTDIQLLGQNVNSYRDPSGKKTFAELLAAVGEIPGIRRVRSRTFRGATEISAQFDPNTDMAAALQQLQNRVVEVRQDLPAETTLAVERLTVSSFPMLSLNLTGGLPTPDLNDYAFYVIRPALARVPGVGRVEVSATDTREIEVVADPGRLLADGLHDARMSMP